MTEDKILVSAVRSTGDLSGVFEYDGETGYFYLYQTGDRENKVLAANHILSGQADFGEADVDVRWDDNADKVALFIRGVPWAIFEATLGTKLGGNYRPGALPDLPQSSTSGFKAIP